MSDDCPTTRSRGTFVGEVLANEPVCQHHHRLILDLAGFPPTRPGQFVQLQCRGLGELTGARAVDWPQGGLPHFTQPELTDRETMLRRPFSLGGRRDHSAGRAELDVMMMESTMAQLNSRSLAVALWLFIR